MASPLTVYITRPAAPLCVRVGAILDAGATPSRRSTSPPTTSPSDERAHRLLVLPPLVVIGDHIIARLEETIEADRSGRLADLLAISDSDPADAQERNRGA
jgi:hypothetical protein